MKHLIPNLVAIGVMAVSPAAFAAEQPQDQQSPKPECEMAHDGKTMTCCEKGSDGKKAGQVMDHGQMEHGTMDHGTMDHGQMKHGSDHHGHSAPQPQ